MDLDFRGEVKVLILNWVDSQFLVKRGQQIAQGIFLPALKVKFQQQHELPTSLPNIAGFGSTKVQ